MKKFINVVLVLAILINQNLKVDAFLEPVDLSSLEQKTNIHIDISTTQNHESTHSVLAGCEDADFVEGQLIVTLNPDRSRISRVKKTGKKKYYEALSSQMQKYLKAKINSKDLIAIRQQYAPIDYEGKISNQLKLAKIANKTKKLELKRIERRTSFNKYLESSDSHRTFLVSTKYSCQELADLKQELENDPKIKLVRYNYIVKATTNDTYFNSTGNTANWGFAENELWGIKKIKAPEAWDKGIKGEGIIVAVIDSGLDTQHPDLDANIWKNNEEIVNNGIDDDRNGRVDDINGWDFVGTSSSSSAFASYIGDANVEDMDGHGTHVSGTIAAEGDNNEGVVGVAYKAKIMPLRALDDKGRGNDFAIEDALIYATNEGADVINMSLGSKKTESVYQQEILDAISRNVTVVVAAGNSELDASAFHPANIADVITVGASTPTDKRASFSNYGTTVDICAPGGADAPGKKITLNFPVNHKLLANLPVAGINTFPRDFKFTTQYTLIGNSYSIERGFRLPAPYSLHAEEGGPGTLPLGYVFDNTYSLLNNLVIPANTIINARIFLDSIDRNITSINKDAIIDGYSQSYNNTNNILSTVPTRSQPSNEYLVFNGNTSNYHLYFDKTLSSHLTNIASIPNSNKLGSQTEHGYYAFEGTSMSAPHVAGVAALALSMNPDLSPTLVRTLLVSQAESITQDSGKNIGPRVNALNVVNKLTITKPIISSTSGANGRLKARWNATSDGRGVPATSYEYGFSRTATIGTLVEPAGTSLDISKAAGPYTLYVRACNEYNCSPWSDPVSITVTAATPTKPAPVTNALPQNRSFVLGSEVTLSWVASTTPGVSYVVKLPVPCASGACRPEELIRRQPVVAGDRSYKFTPTRLEGNTTDGYSIEIVAVLAGVDSDPARATFAMTAPPIQVSGVTPNTLNILRPTITWTPVPSLAGYDLLLTKDGVSLPLISVTGGSTGSYPFPSNLDRDSSYTIQIRGKGIATNSLGQYGTEYPFTVAAPRAFVPKTEILTPLFDGMVNNTRRPGVSWLAIPNATSYQLTMYAYNDITRTYDIKVGETQSTSGTATTWYQDLSDGLYSVEIQACNSTACSNPKGRPFAVGPAPVVGIPKNNKRSILTLNPAGMVYDITSNPRPNLNWTPKELSYVTPVYYLVTLTDVTNFPISTTQIFANPVKVSATTRSLNFLTDAVSLTAGHRYRYTVTGVYSDANETFDSNLFFYHDTAATLPGSFSITSTTTSYARTSPLLVTWSASSGAIYYDVRIQVKNPVGSATPYTDIDALNSRAEPPATSFTYIAGTLAPGSYRFKVAAVNNKGPIPWSYKNFTIQ